MLMKLGKQTIEVTKTKDVEIYKKAGWVVVEVKPVYNDRQMQPLKHPALPKSVLAKRRKEYHVRHR